MKKTVLAISILSLLVILALSASAETIEIPCVDEAGSTGNFYSWDDGATWDLQPQSGISMSGGTPLNVGFCLFDLSEMPEDVAILEIEIFVWVSTGDATALVDLWSFPIFPDGENDTESANSMETPFVEDWPGLDGFMFQNTVMNVDANADMNALLATGETVWGVGFSCTDGFGSFGGWNGDGVPYLVVEYATAPPEPPTNFVASYLPPSDAALSWVDVAENEQSYEIQRRYRADEEAIYGMWIFGASLEPDYDEVNITLPIVGLHQFRIQAVNAVGASDWVESEEIEIFQAPEPPIDVTLEFEIPNSIQITWTDVAETEENYYLDYRYQTVGGPMGSWTAFNYGIPDNATSTNFPPFDVGTFQFRLAAWNIAGQSDWTESDQMMIHEYPSEPSAFATVYNGETASVELDWVDDSDSEIEFQIERRFWDNEWLDWEWVFSTEADATTWADNDVLENEIYEYQIRAATTTRVSDWVVSQVNTNGIEEVTSNLPFTTKLNSVYPNPFNGMTSVSFELETNGLVTIGIYNINGQQLGLVTNGEFVAGKHALSADFNHLSSGTYFLNFSAGAVHEVQRVTLIK